MGAGFRLPRLSDERVPRGEICFARSKAKAMHPEIARNQNYDDHYANYSEDVHSFCSRIYFILYMSRRCDRTPRLRNTIGLLPPPTISVITTTSKKHQNHNDNQNCCHGFLQIYNGEISPVSCWSYITTLPASESDLVLAVASSA